IGLARLVHLRDLVVREAVDPLPAAVEVVEAVVLLVEHHDVIDLGETRQTRIRLLRCGRRNGRDQSDRNRKRTERNENAFEHVPAFRRGCWTSSATSQSALSSWGKLR